MSVLCCPLWANSYLLLPVKAPPKLGGLNHNLIIYTEARLSKVVLLHMVSPGLAHQAGIFLTCLECHGWNHWDQPHISL